MSRGTDARVARVTTLALVFWTVEIQTSSITNRWYRFWCRVGIFTMQCAGTMMTQHLITIKKVAGPRPGAVRLAMPSGSRDATGSSSSSELELSDE